MTLTWVEFESWMDRDAMPLDEAAGVDGDQRWVRTMRDGTIVKIFRPARRARYGGRFCRSARRLRLRGVSTVEVIDRFRVSAAGGDRDGVRYEPLVGRSIESILQAGGGSDETAAFGGLAGFMARLHASGIYFRGLHFGNVIVTPDGGYGLIDVTDTRFRPWPLTVGERARNFRPMLRYADQRAGLERYGAGRLAAQYLRAAGLSALATQRLTERLARMDALVDVGSRTVEQ